MVPDTAPEQRGPRWWGHRFGIAWYSPRMLKMPISRLPARTIRWLPEGTSVDAPIKYSLGTGVRRVEVEEADGVAAHDLSARLGAKGEPEDVLRVIEIVVGPIRREHRAVLSVEELE